MNIRDRIKELRRVKASELIPSPKNWRTHPKAQKDALRGVLAEIGFAAPLVARVVRGGKLQLIDGHLRAETTPNTKVPVVVLDVTAEEADKLLLSMDPLSALAGRDDTRLEDLLGSVKFESDAVMKMLSDLRSAEAEAIPRTDADEVPAEPKKVYVKKGELYELGKHRILCGDSTKPEDVDRLMDGDKAQICWTDPPWNVAYDGKDGIHKGKTRTAQHAPITNDNLGEAFPGFCAAFAGEISRVLRPGAPIYIAMSSSEWPTIDGALRGMGMKWSSTIVWAKESFVIGRRDYHAQYEPIWYGWKEGAARLVEIEDRTQSDLWNIQRPKRSDEHPTMKPVELIFRALKNSSRPGAIVFEPFSGSGSTIIAAEQTGRRCRAIELEPKYVQVAIERWEKFANAKATRR